MTDEEIIKFSVDAFNPVKEQHYVPCNFLAAWGRRIEKGRHWEYYIYCREDKGSVQNKRVRKVAKWSYLYSYPDLTLTDIQQIIYHLTIEQSFDRMLAKCVYQQGIFTTLYLMYLSGNKSAELLVATEIVLSNDILSQDYKRILRLAMRSDFERIMRVVPEARGLLDKIGIAKKNGFEHLLSIQEKMFYPSLNAAQNDDLSFYNRSNDRTAFVHYLFTQLLRTRKFDELLGVELDQYGVDVNVSALMRYLRFENMYKAAKTVVESIGEYELVLLENNTMLEFISGDQPLCNLVVNMDANQFDLYYPISPTRGLFFAKKGGLMVYIAISVN